MDMGDSSCITSMLWNWNTIDSCFLSSSWHIESRGQFAGSVIGVFLLVVAIEGLRRLGREYDRRLVAATRAAQKGSLVAAGRGPASCCATEKTASAPLPKPVSASGSCCSKRNNSSSGSSSAEEGLDEINVLQPTRSRDLEQASTPVHELSEKHASSSSCHSSNSSTGHKHKHSHAQPQGRFGKGSKRKLRLGPIQPTWPQQVMRGIFHGSQFSAAFLVMLIGMYFNGYMLLAIFAGATVGSIMFTADQILCPQTGSDGSACCGEDEQS